MQLQSSVERDYVPGTTMQEPSTKGGYDQTTDND